MLVIWVVIIILAVKAIIIFNKISESKKRIDFIVLDSLINSSGLCTEEIITNVNYNKEFIEINFYKIINKLLKEDLVTKYVEGGDLIVGGRVFYKITSKGRRSHLEHLDWELERVKKEQYLSRRSGDLDQYEIASDRELKLRNKLLETHLINRNKLC